MSKGGFDPSRVDAGKRDKPVIPQMLSAETPRLAKGFTEIKVVGLGGAGSNTVDRMIESGVQGIDFIAVNSDVQALDRTLARTRVRIGERVTRGLGAGGDPKVGERAIEPEKDAVREVLAGADMVFVTAGLGGGTGTGAAPVVAEIAQEVGALTVGVVTLPFSFEGSRRRAIALEGLDRLRPHLDSSIVISNDRLLQIAPAQTGIAQAFRMADDTLHQGIHGIADLILTPGLINLDFADVNAVLQRSGPTLMAMGTASGEGRARRAIEKAIASPLLDASISGARAVLLNVTGGPDLTLYEVNEAADLVSSKVAPDCNIIFGAVIHPKLKDEIRITVIAAGFGRA
ncbi:MAG TPA: cell division protein FtsZ [Chloroflexota bacterium]|nr:cell division protein FtsZ [Chloroflexota bacterium]